MKILLTSLFCVLAVSATASEKINIINHYKVGGVNHRAAEYVSRSNSTAFEEVTNVGTCLDVVKILKNTDKPTIAVWDMVGLATRQDKSCDIVTQQNFITIYATAYNKICIHKNADDNALTKLLTDDVKVGFPASTHLYKVLIENTLKQLNDKATAVPYKNTGELFAALEIGEINYTYAGSTRDFTKCILTADSTSTDIPSFSEYFDGAFSTANYSIVFIGVNIDKDKVNTLLETTYYNSDWNDTFLGYTYVLAKKPIQYQYDFLVNSISTFTNILTIDD